MQPRSEADPGRAALLTVAAGCLLLALAPAALAGQEGDGSARAEADTAAAAADSLPVYEREVFGYPTANRRNPFQPIQTGEEGGSGPRFEDLTLSGIIYNPSLGSVVVLVDTNLQKRYRLREGDRVGQTRVVDIRPNEVEFSISGATGGARREVLRVKQEQEGSEG